jgi:hypothetical protein
MAGGRLSMCNTNAHNVESMCIAAHSAPAPKTVAVTVRTALSLVRSQRQATSGVFGDASLPSLYFNP